MIRKIVRQGVIIRMRQAGAAIAAGAVALALAACDGLPGPLPPPKPAPTEAPLPTRAVTPRAAIVVDGVLALGTPPILPAFETAGKVIAVNAQPGQKVLQGDVLAQLDDGALQDALAQARESLAVIEAQVAQSAAPARESDIQAAQASLSSAAARYREVKQGTTADEVEQALRNWNMAKNNLYSIQVGRDAACARDLDLPQPLKDRARANVNCTTAEAQVKAAEENERAAYARYQAALQPVSRDRLTQAYADVAAAQANLDKLKSGPSEAQKKVAQAQLDQARTGVTRAERRLGQATLRSPCDCSVQDVNIAPGAAIAPGAPAFRLVNLNSVVFRTTNLSERDLGSIKAGAPASIRLKPFDKPFRGTVKAVLPQSANGQGAGGATAVFTVLIDVEPAGTELLPGMTGQAEITVQAE